MRKGKDSDMDMFDVLQASSSKFLGIFIREKKTRVATALLAVKALWKHTFGLRELLPSSESQVILRAEATKYVCPVFFHNVNYGSSFPPAWMNGSENVPHLAKSTLGAGENS